MRKSCNCGQEWKTVVLVGCTQHGKSSLIRSILDYGGYRSEADHVKIGGFGNNSTTKNAKTFEAIIHLRKHYLADQYGNVITGNFVDEVEDVTELKTTAYPAKQHIHLRIIDTPGLDDSDNPSGSDGDTGEGSAEREVDEKHKLTVLKALAAMDSIHTVCIVLSIDSTLGKSTTSLLGEYFRLFEASGLGGSYNFAHTKVGLDRRFVDNIINRPGVVDEKFAVSSKAKHHFINNLPEETLPASLYLAQSAIAGLLTSISLDKPQPIGELNFPKSDGHRVLDSLLKDAFSAVVAHHMITVRETETKVKDLEARKRRLAARKDSEYESYRQLDREYDEINTTDLVLIGSRSESERAHFFSRSRCYFSISTNAPIRDVETDKNYLAEWSPSLSKTDLYGETYCSTVLVGDKWDVAINGCIKLYGWKKEAQKERLEEKKTEKEQARSEWSSTLSQHGDVKKEIESAQASLDSLRAKENSLREKERALGGRNIPLDALKTRGQYLSSSNLVSYAYGMGITNPAVDKTWLPPTNVASLADTAWKKYSGRSSSFQSVLASTEAMLGFIRSSVSTLQFKLREVEATLREVKGMIEELKAEFDGLTPWASNADLADLSEADQEVARRVLAVFQARFEPHLEKGMELAEEAIGNVGERLQARQRLLDDARRIFKGLLVGAAAMEKTWEERKLDAQASIRALEAMEIVCKRSCVPLGVFAVLLNGMHEFGEQSERAWEQLFRMFKGAYRCDGDGDTWVLFLDHLRV
jgi:GTPase SAR1 family protein